MLVDFVPVRLSLQKQYRKDLEQEVKGRGLSGLGLEETPELLRVKKANQILNQVKHSPVRLTEDVTQPRADVCCLSFADRRSIAKIWRERSWVKGWS